MKRGLASEKRVLSEMGLTKNTGKVSGVEGRSIPDAITDASIIDIKDAKRVSSTKQMRIQQEAAANASKKHVVITGNNTRVSSKLKEKSSVVRRVDLGPQE